jgi:hypothetical protein
MEKYGLNFDLSLINQYDDGVSGIDTWYYQVLTNQEKRGKLLEACKSKHHQEVGCDAIINSSNSLLEDNEDIFARVQLLKVFLQ